MSLSAELARPLPKVPRPYLPKKCLLETEVDRLSATFGGVPREVAPIPDLMSQIEAALGPDGVSLAKLDRRGLKVVPYIIWGPNPAWRLNRSFIRRYLGIMAAGSRTALKRLWRHYLLNFDPYTPATQEFAAWLAIRVSDLSSALQEFSQTYAVLDTDRASSTMAADVLSGGRFLERIEELGFGSEAFRSSALLLEVLAAAGHQLASPSPAFRVVEKLTGLMGGKSHNAIAEAVGTEGARARALRSIVDGLVSWQERVDPQASAPEPVVDLLLALNGDPRFARHRWQGHVSDRSIAAVESWLSRKTIEAFFRVIDTMKTDRDDMWRARRKFWLSYLPYISKAWLVAGAHAAPIAEKEGLRFGRFQAGDGTLPNHCGLMLQIRDLNVLEMNKDGSAIFWGSGTRGLPGLYEDWYNRYQYRSRKNNRDVFVLGHHVGWEARFRDRIVQMTRIHVSC